MLPARSRRWKAKACSHVRIKKSGRLGLRDGREGDMTVDDRWERQKAWHKIVPRWLRWDLVAAEMWRVGRYGLRASGLQ